ncbi:MAG: alpha/beta fold hydrolase [Gammaproteobacteria bacterium]|nr:alpha/beta fold hydrolase [Gammaproteobacteria bacterium]
MNRRLVLINIILLFFTVNISAEKIIIKTADKFDLIADYTSANINSSKGVLMLHQCNADRTMYKGLAKNLAKNGIHSLALDYRGYGESVNDEYSLKKIRESATNEKEYWTKVDFIVEKFWQSDIQAAYTLLVEKVGSDNISFIGASCGGTQSILLANNYKPKSFIFFSAGMKDKTIKNFQKLSDVPALIVASVGDKYTYQSSNTIFLGAKNPNSRLISYKGKGHGKPLFEHDNNLENSMVEWFKVNQ